MKAPVPFGDPGLFICFSPVLIRASSVATESPGDPDAGRECGNEAYQPVGQPETEVAAPALMLVCKPAASFATPSSQEVPSLRRILRALILPELWGVEVLGPTVVFDSRVVRPQHITCVSRMVREHIAHLVSRNPEHHRHQTRQQRQPRDPIENIPSHPSHKSMLPSSDPFLIFFANGPLTRVVA